MSTYIFGENIVSIFGGKEYKKQENLPPAGSFLGSLFELKMEPVCSSEILLNFYWSTWCYATEESVLQNQYW
jgi:hypothetical protein